MIKPRHARLSSLAKISLTRSKLPTGSSFGGSRLKINQSEELVFSIVSDSVLIANYPTSVYLEPPSPLVIEVGKIIVVAIWFWCLIGANFCFDSISTAVGYGTEDI
jgi:hypothetical protein